MTAVRCCKRAIQLPARSVRARDEPQEPELFHAGVASMVIFLYLFSFSSQRIVNNLGLAKVGKTLARRVQGAYAMWLARRALLPERWPLCVTTQSLLVGLRSVASESRGNLAAVVCCLVL